MLTAIMHWNLILYTIAYISFHLPYRFYSNHKIKHCVQKHFGVDDSKDGAVAVLMFDQIMWAQVYILPRNLKIFFFFYFILLFDLYSHWNVLRYVVLHEYTDRWKITIIKNSRCTCRIQFKKSNLKINVIFKDVTSYRIIQ